MRKIFHSWKVSIVLLLQEYELLDIVNNRTRDPMIVPTNPTTKESFKKKNIMENISMLDAIKDHIIPHVTGKYNTYHMCDALTNLY